MYNDQLVYKVVIWAFFGISLWNEKVTLIKYLKRLWTENVVLSWLEHYNHLLKKLSLSVW